MALDKRWQETFDRLDAIEKAIRERDGKAVSTVTKEDLMKIKGVGSSIADEILKLINK